MSAHAFMQDAQNPAATAAPSAPRLGRKKLMRPIQKVFAIPIEVVFFDIGETLIDETRLWAGWPAHLGVSSNEFLHVPHETIERGR